MAQSIKQNLLYSEIKELCENIFHQISYQTVITDLKISYAQYLSYFYKINHAFEIPEYFDKDNLEVLKELLEYFHYDEFIKVFSKWGVFFNREEFLDWLEFYISIFSSSLFNHKINIDSLEISLLGCKNPTDGFAFYCNNHIDEETILNKAADLFLREKKIKRNELNFYNLKKYIESCYEKKILSSDFLYKDFYEILYKEALRHNFITHNKKETLILPKNDPLHQYLAILEINSIPKNKEELKKIYYHLIKKYHPDTNPNGLEKTKSIIEAYSCLIKIYE